MLIALLSLILSGPPDAEAEAAYEPAPDAEACAMADLLHETAQELFEGLVFERVMLQRMADGLPASLSRDGVRDPLLGTVRRVLRERADAAHDMTVLADLQAMRADELRAALCGLFAPQADGIDAPDL
ncbi:MAG: hypothetical protein ACK4E3_10575 [Brevundimonas sp.]|uniref:hypothetical protein n=1 Tax=Brevundimonas sp. TaxID=1871086 RepID=UPI00391CFF8C